MFCTGTTVEESYLLVRLFIVIPTHCTLCVLYLGVNQISQQWWQRLEQDAEAQELPSTPTKKKKQEGKKFEDITNHCLIYHFQLGELITLNILYLCTQMSYGDENETNLILFSHFFLTYVFKILGLGCGVKISQFSQTQVFCYYWVLWS